VVKIQLHNICKRYGRREVVSDVSLTVEQGEIVGLLGPNGAGKTTTFYITTGLVQPNRGQVLLDQQEITHLPMHRRARLGIGYLPQEPSIFRRLSIQDNLLLIMEQTGVPRRLWGQRLTELLTEFRITHVAKSLGVQVSGGERRRAEIARALAAGEYGPKFLLLDEPFAGVDPIAVADIQEVVARLKNRGIGVLITDHNVRETLEITDRAYILNEGSILAKGSAADLAADPLVRKYYLGEKFRL
jgi:lipopolysaccharide export system ATP-binding protein